MKKFISLYGLLVVTSSLVGMRREGFDGASPIREKIVRLLHDCRSEFKVPEEVSLKLALGGDLPEFNGIRAMAGLKIGKKKEFAQSNPYLALMVFSDDFVKFPYGLQRGTILKMLFNIMQFNPILGPITIDSTHYPKGVHQEAAAQALLHLKCFSCARDFMRSLPEKSAMFFTQAEADELLKTMDQAQVCAYHKDYCEMG